MARCATMAHGKNFIFSGVLMDVCFPGASLNDGQWHSVELNSRQGRLTITVDKEERDSSQASPSFPVTVESHLFFGGKTQFSCVIPCNYTHSSISEHKMQKLCNKPKNIQNSLSTVHQLVSYSHSLHHNTAMFQGGFPHTIHISVHLYKSVVFVFWCTFILLTLAICCDSLLFRLSC